MSRSPCQAHLFAVGHQRVTPALFTMQVYENSANLNLIITFLHTELALTGLSNEQQKDGHFDCCTLKRRHI